MAYDRYTHTSISDLDIEDSRFIVRVKASVRFLTSQEGGRSKPVFNRYRPNHMFEYEDDSLRFKAFMGELVCREVEKIELGRKYKIEIRFVMHRGLEKYLENGIKWWMYEGPVLLGEGEMLEILGDGLSGLGDGQEKI